MQKDDSVAIDDVEVIREGGLALLCRLGGREIWIPRAQILNGGVHAVGDRGTIVVPRWFAADHGLD
jgi:hypothetical protein